MSAVKVDPDDLEAFNKELQDYATNTRQHLARLASRLRDMGASSWSDRKYTEFVDDFERVEGAMVRNLEDIEADHVPKIRTMIEHLRDYQGS